MARRAVIHPRIFDRIPQFFPSRCTIQAGAEVRSASGSPAYTWTAMPDLIDVQCMVAPFNRETPTGQNEAKLESMVYLTVTHHCLLRGLYTEIEPRMRAVVDGEAYDIQAVEHDSQRSLTRLRLNKVTP
jgi:hypothetical protein